MRFLKKHRILICIIAVIGILAALAYFLNQSGENPENSEFTAKVQTTDSYELYLSGKEAVYPEETIVLYGGDYVEADEGFTYLEDYMELGNACVATLEEGSVTYQVEVKEAGFYHLLLVYYPMEGKNNDIGRTIYINGEIPYEEAQYLEFTRIWQNQSEITRDSRDNDVRPKQEEAPAWITEYCKDSNGFYTGALYFYLEEGQNTITMESTQEPMVIGQLILTQEVPLMTYQEYKCKNY